MKHGEEGVSPEPGFDSLVCYLEVSMTIDAQSKLAARHGIFEASALPWNATIDTLLIITAFELSLTGPCLSARWRLWSLPLSPPPFR